MSIQTQIEALQTDKTNIRNAILNKGGTSASGNGFDDFATDIATIPSGITPTGSVSITENGTYDVTDKAQAVVNVSGGGVSEMILSQATGLSRLFYISKDRHKAILPENLTINAPNCIDVSYMFGNYYVGGSGVVNLTLNLCTQYSGAIDFSSFSYRNNDIKILNLQDGIKVSAVRMLDESNIETINGRMDMSLHANTDRYSWGSTIKNISFVPNTYMINCFVQGASLLTDASIVSFANSLNETTTGKSITFHATPKARCSTILGTVALDTTGTFHIFTQDASGTTTLQDFITNTKGWTIA